MQENHFDVHVYTYRHAQVLRPGFETEAYGYLVLE